MPPRWGWLTNNKTRNTVAGMIDPGYLRSRAKLSPPRIGRPSLQAADGACAVRPHAGHLSFYWKRHYTCRCAAPVRGLIYITRWKPSVFGGYARLNTAALFR